MARKNREAKGTVNKVARFKLRKDQKEYVKNLLTLENRIAVCQEYISLWLKYFQFFARSTEERQIEASEEKAFFQTMTALSRKQFQFAEAMGPVFEHGSEIVHVLSMSVSLAHIQVMDDNTRSKLELDWHSLLLEMNKSLGRLLRILPGNMTLSEALERVKQEKPLDAKSLKAEGSKSKRGSMGPDEIKLQEESTKGAVSDKKRLVALLLCFLVGPLGVHRFYVGKVGTGIFQIVTFGGFLIWVLIDLIMIIVGSFTDKQGCKLENWT